MLLAITFRIFQNMTTPSDKTITLPESIFLKVGTLEGREKVSIGLTGTGAHFTITNNGARRVINAHITYDDHSRRPDYLCELSYFTWARLQVRMRQVLLPLQRQFFLSRTVNLGRLKRHGLFFLTGNPDPEAEKAIVRVNSGKTSIRSRKKILVSALHKIIKYTDDVPTDDAKFYFLFASNRGSIQGIIYRNPAAPWSKRYFLVTGKMYRQFCKEHNDIFYSILTELHFKGKERLLQLFEEKLMCRDKIGAKAK